MKSSNLEWAQYAAFSLFCFWAFLSYVNIDSLFGVHLELVISGLKLITAFFLLLAIVKQRFKPDRLLLIFAVSFVIFISGYIAHSLDLIWLLLFSIAVVNPNIQVFAKISFVVSLIVLMCTVLGCFSGVIEDVIVLRNITNEMRHSFGFKHPNSFSLVLLVICTSYYLMSFPRFRISCLILSILVFFLMGFLTDSRTAMMALAGAFVLYFVANRVFSNVKRRKIYILICGALFLLELAVSTFLMIWFDSSIPFYQDLSLLMSGRPTLANQYFEQYSIAVIGTNIPYEVLSNTTSSTDGFVVDNAFSNILLRYGFLPFLIYSVSYIGIFVKAYKSGLLGAGVVGLSMWIPVAFAEQAIMALAFNYSMLMFSAYFHAPQKPFLRMDRDANSMLS